jgi:hypothetical protein
MPLSRLVLPRPLSPLLPWREPVTPASPSAPPVARREILARYRHLRQISKEQHQAVLDVIAPNVMLNWAKRLGLARGRTLLLESELELLLAEDLAIYLSRPGRSHPLDRHARAARLAPGSDQAILLEAMRQAQFSLWRVERWHETTGLILRDLLRGGEAWLLDETLAKTTPPGLEFAARLLQPDAFAMTARIIVPLIPGLMEQVFARAPVLQRVPADALAREPPFAIGIYQAAVATGAMNAVRLKRKRRWGPLSYP